MPKIYVPVTKHYEYDKRNCLSSILTCCGLFEKRPDFFGYLCLEPTFHTSDKLRKLKEDYEKTRANAFGKYFPAMVAIAVFAVNEQNELTKCIKLYRLKSALSARKEYDENQPLLQLSWEKIQLKEGDMSAELLGKFNEAYQSYLLESLDKPLARPGAL